MIDMGTIEGTYGSSLAVEADTDFHEVRLVLFDEDDVESIAIELSPEEAENLAALIADAATFAYEARAKEEC